MKKILTSIIVVFVSASYLFCQNKAIKGRVISDQFDIMIGVSIMINDTVKVGKTDLKGFFQIIIPDSVKKLSFRDIGMEPTIIMLADNCDEVEVVMMLRGTYDFITLKKADRIRKKKLKRLPEIHKKAFEKGLFKKEIGCYTQVFIPYFKKKQKMY